MEKVYAFSKITAENEVIQSKQLLELFDWQQSYHSYDFTWFLLTQNGFLLLWNSCVVTCYPYTCITATMYTYMHVAVTSMLQFINSHANGVVRKKYEIRTRLDSIITHTQSGKSSSFCKCQRKRKAYHIKFLTFFLLLPVISVLLFVIAYLCNVCMYTCNVSCFCGTHCEERLCATCVNL